MKKFFIIIFLLACSHTSITHAGMINSLDATHSSTEANCKLIKGAKWDSQHSYCACPSTDMVASFADKKCMNLTEDTSIISGYKALSPVGVIALKARGVSYYAFIRGTTENDGIQLDSKGVCAPPKKGEVMYLSPAYFGFDTKGTQYEDIVYDLYNSTTAQTCFIATFGSATKIRNDNKILWRDLKTASAYVNSTNQQKLERLKSLSTEVFFSFFLDGTTQPSRNSLESLSMQYADFMLYIQPDIKKLEKILKK